MVHNNFGDLDDEDNEEEVVDLTAILQLEREEGLESLEDNVKINANEIYHLELDNDKSDNEESEDEKSDDSDWDPANMLVDNIE